MCIMDRTYVRLTLRIIMEEWKKVEGYEDLYEVSSLGQVRSFYNNFSKLRHEPKILKQVLIGHKPDNLYYAVNLYKDKQMKQHSVHRLVAKCFIENKNSLPLVNHRNEIKLDNRKNNLEWCSSQYNQEYSLSKQEYVFLNPLGQKLHIRNLRKFARENSLNHSHMYQVHLGRYKSHKEWTKYESAEN